MPYDNRRSSESGDGLHRHCFTEVRFFKWQPDEVSVSLRAKSGSYGGGSEVLVIDVLPFDTTQITSDKNCSHPRFGDPCHPLAANQHPPHIVIKEIHELPESDRNAFAGSASRELQRPGCV